MTNAAEIMKFLNGYRFPINTEIDLQISMQDVLIEGGFDSRREVFLSARDKVDFMVGTVAIECKIHGTNTHPQILRQISRYCEHEDVSELILATNISMTLPRSLHDKKVFYLNLAAAWL